MATTYTAQNFPLSVGGLTDSGTGLDVTSMFSYDISTGSAFIINDVVLLAKIPVGAVITDYLVNIPALDSSTGLRGALGDNTGSAGVFNATFQAASTAGISGGTGILTPLGTLISATLTATYVAASVPTATWSTAGAVTTIYTQSVPTAGLYIGNWVFAYKVTTAATGTASTTGVINGWVRYNMRSTAF